MERSELSGESLKDYILMLKTSLKQNESLVSNLEILAKDVIKDHSKSDRRGRRPGTFWVTDLVNPMHAYMAIKNPLIKDPEDLKKIFSHGNFVEQRMISILERDERFASYQGTVTGESINLPQVTGKIDARIGNSIVEIKSSLENVKGAEDIYSNHPQDLEQLLLYILFTNRQSSNHYLVYVTGKHPDTDTSVFKVKIKNKKKLSNYFNERFSKLKSSLANNDPSGLGKCRYFERKCKFEQYKTCKCESEDKISVNLLKMSTIMEPTDDKDPVFKLVSSSVQSTIIRFWDLFSPRKWLLKQDNPFYYEEIDDEGYYHMRISLEQKLLKQSSEYLKFSKKKSSKTDINESFITLNEEPLIVRFTRGKPQNYVNEWYLSQLGLIALSQGLKSGYVFTFYKDVNVGKLWEVKFDKNRFDYYKVKTTIDRMNDALLKKSDYQSLPLCPDFVQNNCGDGCYCKAK